MCVGTQSLPQAALDRLVDRLTGHVRSADRRPAFLAIVHNLDQADGDEAACSIAPHWNDIHQAILAGLGSLTR